MTGCAIWTYEPAFKNITLTLPHYPADTRITSFWIGNLYIGRYGQFFMESAEYQHDNAMALFKSTFTSLTYRPDGEVFDYEPHLYRAYMSEEDEILFRLLVT